MYDELDFEKELVGKVLRERVGKEGGNEMRFITVDGEEYLLYHDQDCCETVEILYICGDLDDLIGSPLLRAEVVSEENSENPEDVDMEELDEYQESYTWTFYKLATIKGSVTIRWYGQSNGYYSEEVSFAKV